MPAEPLPWSGNETGIDVGLQVFLSTADGEGVDTPRQYRKADQQRAHAQRRVSRRQQGSTRRRKAVPLLLKRTQRTVQRQRRDCHHQTARALLRTYDVVSLEEVQVRTLVRNRHLAKRSSAAGWAQVRTILEATAACAGRQVVAVPARLHHPGPE